MSDDINEIAARMRDGANIGGGDWLRPHEIRALLDDWEQRGKELNELRESVQLWKEQAYHWEKRAFPNHPGV